MLKNRFTRSQVYTRPSYWDSKAEEYSGHSVSMWPNNALNAFYEKEQTQILKRCVGDIRGKKVLDAGCGTGRISRYLAGLGATVRGIDFSAKTIDIAKSQSPEGHPDYRVQSLFDLEDSGMYDLVVSCGLLTVACKTREDLKNILTRLKKSLAPHGRAFFMEPIHRGLLHRVLNMDIREFLEVAGEVGFRIETVDPLHFWPTRLLLAYFNWPRFITAPGYKMGQACMGLPLLKSLGDYKAVYASVAKNH
jgi:2-polyprenyl-3-methyl-5-hydroxy-6-metoxy-1,4-benzoquinol methylase